MVCVVLAGTTCSDSQRGRQLQGYVTMAEDCQTCQVAGMLVFSHVAKQIGSPACVSDIKALQGSCHSHALLRANTHQPTHVHTFM